MAVATKSRDDLLVTRQARLLLAYLEARTAFERARRFAVIGAVVTLLCGLGVYGFSVFNAYQGWITGAWENLDWPTAVALPTIFLVWGVVVLCADLRPYRAASAELRRMLAGESGDALPLVSMQPVPIQPGEYFPLPATVGPLHGLRDASQIASLRSAQTVRLFFVVIFAFLVVPEESSFITTYLSTRDTTSLIVLVVASAVIVAVALWLLMLSARTSRHIVSLSRGLAVTVDADGMRWYDTRTDGRAQTLAWGEISAFLLVWLGNAQGTDSGWAYLLLAERTALLWTWPRYPTSEESAAIERLNRLIVTRTHLPLRDGTWPVAALARALGALTALSPRAQAEKLRWQGIVVPPEVLSERSVTRATRRRVWMWLGLSAATVVALVFTFVPPALQASQARTYDAMLTQAQASVAIFSDTLAQTDTLWTPSPLNPAGSTATFTSQGYILSGGAGQNVENFATQTFPGRDIALSVDEQQATTSSYVGGAGLILRASADQSTVVTFFVFTNGDWMLAREDVTAAHPDGAWTTLLDGSSGNVNQGSGANNTLGVIVHGTSDYCYVDGTLVGFVTNDTAPTSGQVGLFVNDGSVPATFTNFAVYPAS